MKPWSPEWKEEQLRFLAEEWSECRKCEALAARHHVVFGNGNPDADVLLCGESPGEDEDDSGLPFVGKSGCLLQALLNKAGFKWKDLYVTNLIACHPPGNRDPRVTERDACLPRLHAITYIVDPLLVVPIGKFALQALAKGRDWGIKEQSGILFSSPAPDAKFTGERNSFDVRGHVFPRTKSDKLTLTYDMIPILHPAFLLRTDGYDEKNNKFPPGGLAEKTLGHLKHIKNYVDALKEEYASFNTGV